MSAALIDVMEYPTSPRPTPPTWHNLKDARKDPLCGGQMVGARHATVRMQASPAAMTPGGTVGRPACTGRAVLRRRTSCRCQPRILTLDPRRTIAEGSSSGGRAGGVRPRGVGCPMNVAASCWAPHDGAELNHDVVNGRRKSVAIRPFADLQPAEALLSISDRQPGGLLCPCGAARGAN